MNIDLKFYIEVKEIIEKDYINVFVKLCEIYFGNERTNVFNKGLVSEFRLGDV